MLAGRMRAMPSLSAITQARAPSSAAAQYRATVQARRQHSHANTATPTVREMRAPPSSVTATIAISSQSVRKARSHANTIWSMRTTPPLSATSPASQNRALPQASRTTSSSAMSRSSMRSVSVLSRRGCAATRADSAPAPHTRHRSSQRTTGRNSATSSGTRLSSSTVTSVNSASSPSAVPGVSQASAKALAPAGTSITGPTRGADDAGDIGARRRLAVGKGVGQE
ncbi:hypothetical protein ASL20_07665 [Cupriavidus necator]|nr:hypothetical protein C265_20749 [Cupriavidus sp. GA3-3]KUE89555.1 hypothetical protein ASL20_07665 [Cupriavidus necator]